MKTAPAGKIKEVEPVHPNKENIPILMEKLKAIRAEKSTIVGSVNLNKENLPPVVMSNESATSVKKAIDGKELKVGETVDLGKTNLPPIVEEESKQEGVAELSRENVPPVVEGPLKTVEDAESKVVEVANPTNESTQPATLNQTKLNQTFILPGNIFTAL